MFQILIVGYILAFAGLILTCYQPKFKKYHLASKCLCSLGFLLAAWLGKMRSPDDVLFWRLFPALLCCFFGDYFLAKRTSEEDERLLCLGIFSFLLGHAAFLFAFQIVYPLDLSTLLLPLFGVALVAGLLRLPLMETGKLKFPVLIYSYFVTALFVKCAQLAFHGDGGIFYWLVFFGGLLFLLSDGIILFLYFYQQKYGMMKFLNLLTYYSAAFLLAISIVYI